MMRDTTARGPHVGEALGTVGLRCLVRRKCANCGTVTNHAYLRGDGDEHRDYAETLAGHSRPGWDWCETLAEQAKELDRLAGFAADFLPDANRHGEWHRGRFEGTPEQVEADLWGLGVRLRAAEDMSDDDDDRRRCDGKYEWWPDQGEMIVTPDLRASDREVVILLRAAQRFIVDDEFRARFGGGESTPDGPCFSMGHYTITADVARTPQGAVRNSGQGHA